MPDAIKGFKAIFHISEHEYQRILNGSTRRRKLAVHERNQDVVATPDRFAQRRADENFTTRTIMLDIANILMRNMD